MTDPETLRQQLQGQGGMGSATVTYIWPILEAALAAVRVATATEIAEAIEAEFRRDRSMTPFAVEHGISIVRAALARWSVPAPKGDQ